jgi:hypothetical protein
MGGDDERARSPELEQVRQLLFPNLPPAEGWARIDAAIAGAADPERIDAIERLAGTDLSGDLMTILARVREGEGGADRRCGRDRLRSRDVSQHALERPRHAAEIESLDQQAGIADLPPPAATHPPA